MYMPDAIAATHVGGDKYFVTANEGDSRDYDCYSEEERVKEFGLGDDYDDALEDDASLGRLKTTSALPTTFDDDQIEQVYAYGARSFTIWNPAGKVVFDSGDDFEQILATSFPQFFVDNRSDDKGPEPEALAIGEMDGHTYAFVGLDRSGGIMMYDISDPANSTFVDYINTLDEGDISPEGIVFVAAADSPTGTALLVVSHEVSGTTTIYEVG